MVDNDGSQGHYKNGPQFDQANPFRKWCGPYEFSTDELHWMQQKNSSPVWTAVFDVSVAQTPKAPLIINQQGRAFRITGMTTATKYDPVANTGIETVASTVFVGASLLNQPGNNQSLSDPSEFITIKHGGGFRGDFQALAFFWPAQASNSVRITIYRFNGVPWASGDAST